MRVPVQFKRRHPLRRSGGGSAFRRGRRQLFRGMDPAKRAVPIPRRNCRPPRWKAGPRPASPLCRRASRHGPSHDAPRAVTRGAPGCNRDLRPLFESGIRTRDKMITSHPLYPPELSHGCPYGIRTRDLRLAPPLYRTELIGTCGTDAVRPRHTPWQSQAHRTGLASRYRCETPCFGSRLAPAARRQFLRRHSRPVPSPVRERRENKNAPGGSLPGRSLYTGGRATDLLDLIRSGRLRAQVVPGLGHRQAEHCRTAAFGPQRVAVMCDGWCHGTLRVEKSHRLMRAARTIRLRFAARKTFVKPRLRASTFAGRPSDRQGVGLNPACKSANKKPGRLAAARLHCRLRGTTSWRRSARALPAAGRLPGLCRRSP